MWKLPAVAVILAGLAAPASADDAIGALWTPSVLAKIRDKTTLAPAVEVRTDHLEVFYDSESGDANWGDSGPPYEVHTGGTIRIHGYLAAPASGGPYPAIVVGHGHGGSGSRELAVVLAALGYVVLSIDGPRAGLSTGGPEDTEQAWITVEPSADYSYLYHYAYAGMRALTLFELLADIPGNPLRIDSGRMGVLGASMGGQFTYYVNGVDDRVKAAVAIAVAGDWFHTMFYEGSWLYHGLYYYTRDGLASGVDWPNAVADVCRDPTITTFLANFDPAGYAPTQHGRLLTIIGSHDQYFPLPAINSTFDKVRSAGTDPGFSSRLLIVADGKHAVVDGAPLLAGTAVLATAIDWLNHAFENGPAPPPTPAVVRWQVGDTLFFAIPARAGDRPIRASRLHYATQVDTTIQPACDFRSMRMIPFGDAYLGWVTLGSAAGCGPPVTADNLIYFASVSDHAGYTVTSKFYRGGREMTFSSAFTPIIEHFPRDEFPVPAPPQRCDP
jgi:hypothetical protein